MMAMAMAMATTDKKRQAVEHLDLQGVETELIRRRRVQRETAMAIWAMVIVTVLLALLVCWRCEAQELTRTREITTPLDPVPSQYCDVYIRAPLRAKGATTLTDGRVITETRPDWPDWDVAKGILPVEASEAQDLGELLDKSGDHLWLVRLHTCRGGSWLVSLRRLVTRKHPNADLIYEVEVESEDCQMGAKKCFKLLKDLTVVDKESGIYHLKGNYSGSN